MRLETQSMNVVKSQPGGDGFKVMYLMIGNCSTSPPSSQEFINYVFILIKVLLSYKDELEISDLFWLNSETNFNSFVLH